MDHVLNTEIILKYSSKSCKFIQKYNIRLKKVQRYNFKLLPEMRAAADLACPRYEVVLGSNLRQRLISS